MRTVTFDEVKGNLAGLLDSVRVGGERLLITRGDKVVAAIVPAEDAGAMEFLEDQIDLEAARNALRQGEFKSLEEVKAELGIDE